MARDYAERTWKSYAASASAGAFMAFAGAFGSDRQPLVERLTYWIALMLAGAVVGNAVSAFANRRPQLGESRFLRWAAISLLVSAPLTLLVWSVTVMARRMSFRLGDAPYFFGAVLLVSAAMTAISMLVNAPGAATRAAAPGAPTARFLARLPARIMGSALYAVEAEDHYLRVHTSKGADLILMRLADALPELDGIEGAQVHRSWWVARDGVAEVRREGQRITLVLKDGAEAPVSRPNVKALREAGWW